ncbi:sensor histidine kinase [Amaricoccus solimangrovi]|nr:ATP-binding protein [Amaricoccus solimangrovi]
MSKALEIWLALAAGALMAAAVAVPLPPLLAFAIGAVLAFALARLPGRRRAVSFATPEPGAEPPGAAAVEAEARESREMSSAFAQDLVERLPTPLLIIAQGGRISFANSAARAALPRIRSGEHFAGVIRAPAFVEAVNATFADGGERTIEFTTLRDQERFFEARVARLPETGSFGPERQVIVRVDDRTQARRAEQQRSDFIANASHELRTPLAAIIGYVETLQHHARDDPGARERFLGIMAREAGRMRRLVDDLLSLSRIEMHEHLRPSEQWSLNQIAFESATALLPVAEQQGVHLRVEVPTGGAPVAGDRDQLAQVFANLVDNAMKYGGKDAVVRVFAAPPSKAFPNRVGISVSDTGPGIPREHVPRLTERFYRVNASQSRNKGGTGLGLAIVKHILNRHGGRLEIASAPGEGSVFTVWLRPAEAGPAGEAVATEERAPAEADQRIA